MPRRKTGSLVPLEVSILLAGLELRRRDDVGFHGYALANELREREGARRLTSHGTLYKALARLEDMGYLVSEWEDPDPAEAAGRPRRRLYHVTVEGERAAARDLTRPPVSVRRLGLEPS